MVSGVLPAYCGRGPRVRSDPELGLETLGPAWREARRKLKFQRTKKKITCGHSGQGAVDGGARAFSHKSIKIQSVNENKDICTATENDTGLLLAHYDCWRINLRYFLLKHLDRQIMSTSHTDRSVICDDNDLIWQMFASDLHTVKEQGELSPLALEK